MEFRSCPSCKQSVLDDDAKDCPFCGASMSAKPGNTPTQKAATKAAPARKDAIAAPTTPEKRPATANRGPSGKVAPEKPKSNDPFEVETESLEKLFPVRSKPGAGAFYQVKCPMCEKQGYVPEKLINKKVRCHNPACLVPAFVVPPPPKEEVVQVAPKKGLPANAILFIVLGMFATVAFSGWYFFIREKPKEVISGGPFDGGSRQQLELEKDDVRPGDVIKTKVDELTPQQMIDVSLKAIENAAYEQSGARKTSAQQLSAAAYARFGNFEKTNYFLDKITSTSQLLKFQEIVPRLSMSWYLLEQGKPKDSQTALEDASKLRNELPNLGYEANVAAMELAIRMAAADQQEAAMTFLRKYQSTTIDAQLACWQTAVRANRTFDLWREWAWRPLLIDPFPQATTVSRALVALGFTPQSLVWLEGLKNDEAQFHSLAGMMLEVELMTDVQKKASARALIDPVVAKRTPAEQAFIYSRVALVQHYIGRHETSVANYENAFELLKNLDLKPINKDLDIKAIYRDRSFTQPQLTLPATGAYSNLARCCLLINKKDQYTQLISQAIDTSNLTIPSYDAIKTRVKDLEKSTASVKQELSTSLRLNNTADINSAFNTYRNNLLDLSNLAERTKNIQLSILSEAIIDGSIATVQTVLEQSSNASSGRIPLNDTFLVRWLDKIATDSNNQALKEFTQKMIAGKIINTPEELEYKDYLLRSLFDNGDLATAKKKLTAQNTSKEILLALGTIYASRLAGEQKIKQGMDWISNLKDGAVTEESWRSLASLYCFISNDVTLFQTDVRKMGLAPLERANAELGIIEGLQAKKVPLDRPLNSSPDDTKKSMAGK